MGGLMIYACHDDDHGLTGVEPIWQHGRPHRRKPHGRTEGGTDKWKDSRTGGCADEGEKGMREYQWCGGARVAAFFILLAILFIITETKAMAAGPTDSIRNLFGEASRIGDNPARQGSFTLSQKFSLLEEALPRYFDYREMAKRSLGETWNSLNPSQREGFVKDFGSLLKASQARSLLMFNKGRVTYQPQILKAEYAEVPLVIMPPNDKISISFRMFKKTPGWMIYDLVIEEVSSMDHYKAQFARIIQESSFKNLLKVLKAKIQERSLP